LERGVPSEVAAIDHDLLLQAAAMDAFYQRHGPLIHTKQIRHRVIAGMVEGEGVLDVGCGTGDLLLLLQGNGHGRLVGTDVSAVALAMAAERGVEAELIQ
ncbi:MAG: methyltransferase domain-containing protein, partial [Anaerolineae bacterium]|nr:methyltransferase domain-containing protein [Anaerolineae bacterium]